MLSVQACSQKAAAADAVKVGTIGDSITAGVHSSGGNHTYPAQLQIMLDRTYGWGAYSVTNLGACGSTMMKNADSPYWKRPQYQALLNGKQVKNACSTKTEAKVKVCSTMLTAF